jgi:perosamine synthetase
MANEPTRPYLRTQPTLPPSVLLGVSTRGRLPPPLDRAGATFYVKGRNAIWHVLRALDVQQSEIVLVPSYNCGAELDAALGTPARVRFYRVDRCARIDIDDLRRAIEPQTRAVLVTHYFGFPPPDLSAIVELCQDKGLFLIEDCAHALYSTYVGRPLGTFGDAGIFSLWKTLPMPDGGAVLANRPLPLRDGTTTPPLDPCLTALRFSLEAHLLFRFGRIGAMVKKLADPLAPLAKHAGRYVWGETAAAPLDLEPSLNPHVTFDRSTADWSMSAASRRIARRSPHADIAHRRRRNYAFLAGQLATVPGVRLIYPMLPSGVCPLLLPVVVDEPVSLRRHLESDGIATELFWSDFHPAFPAKEFPDSTYLKTHVVALPVHQDLDPGQLARVADAVRRWSRPR